jgi:hypothetical protein
MQIKTDKEWLLLQKTKFGHLLLHHLLLFLVLHYTDTAEKEWFTIRDEKGAVISHAQNN